MRKGSKKTEGLTKKQAKYVDGVANKGMTKTEAALYAGYSPSTQSSVIERTGNVRELMLKALEKRGLTDDVLAKKIEEGLNAKETHFYAYEGVVKDKRTVPDFNVREKYLRNALELKGLIKSNGSIDSINIGLIALPDLNKDEQWNGVIDAEQVKESNIDKSV